MQRVHSHRTSFKVGWFVSFAKPFDPFAIKLVEILKKISAGIRVVGRQMVHFKRKVNEATSFNVATVVACFLSLANHVTDKVH